MTSPVAAPNSSPNFYTASYQQTQSLEASRQSDGVLVQVSSFRSENTTISSYNNDATRPLVEINPEQRISPENAANNVLQFISQKLAKLQAQGASTEKLQVKLDIAKQGFEQGVSEARETLDALGLLNEEQENRIDRVITRFQQGIEEIAQLFIGDDDNFSDQVKDETQRQVLDTTQANTTQPASSTSKNSHDASSASTPSTVQQAGSSNSRSTSIETSNPKSDKSSRPDTATKNNRVSTQFVNNFQQSRVAFLRQESIDLQLRTQDGDLVTISFFGTQGGIVDSRSSQFSLGDSLQLNSSRQISLVFGNTELQITVAGEIDDEEYIALEELLTQLSGIANAFFTGQDKQAFDSALSLDVNDSEIAQFSFVLQSREVQQVTQSYREVASIRRGTHDNANGINIGEFNKNTGFEALLQQLRDRAIEQSQVRIEQSIVEQLLSISFAAASINFGTSATIDAEEVDAIEAG